MRQLIILVLHAENRTTEIADPFLSPRIVTSVTLISTNSDLGIENLPA